MNRKVPMILAVAACLVPGCALPSLPPFPARTKTGRMRQDLNYMVDNLARLHIDAFHSISKDAFLAAADKLDHDIDSLTDQQFAVRMKQLVVMIGDGHTTVIDSVLFNRTLPLLFGQFSDGVFVVAASTEYADLIGTELIAVNDTGIEYVTPKIATVVSRDSEYSLYGDLAPLIAFPDLLTGLGLTADPNTVNFSFRNRDGKTILRQVEAMATKDSNKWVFNPKANATIHHRHADRPYSYEWLPETRALYIAYNQCVNDKQRPFAQFAREVLNVIDDRKPRAVAIDLRHNGGGNSSILKPLIQGLSERETINHSDRLFVLIGPNTFSSAMLNAWQLKVATHATLVGMPTGGKPNSYGELKSFVLPNSKWRVYYCTKYFNVDPEDRPAIMPDVKIEPTSADYFSGIDPVMDYVLSQAARSPASEPPSASSGR